MYSFRLCSFPSFHRSNIFCRKLEVIHNMVEHRRLQGKEFVCDDNFSLQNQNNIHIYFVSHVLIFTLVYVQRYIFPCEKVCILLVFHHLLHFFAPIRRKCRLDELLESYFVIFPTLITCTHTKLQTRETYLVFVLHYLLHYFQFNSQYYCILPTS